MRTRLVAIALCLPLAVSCGRPSTDNAAPRRIVSLAPAITEILFALGVGDRVVGVTEFCDYPEQAARLPKVGGFTTPSVEAIVALRADAVLMSPAVGNRDIASALARAGVRVEIVRAETLEEAYAAMEQVGRFCGEEARGKQLAASVRGRVDETAQRVAHLPRLRTLFCLQREPLIVAGRGTLPAQLLELAGGTNVTEAERYPQIGIETAIGFAPDAIVQSKMDASGPDEEARAHDFWKRWSTIPAVRDKKVFVIDGTTAFRAGPRVGEAVELLAGLLHPPSPAPDSSPR